MTTSQNRSFKWADGPYKVSQEYAADVLDMTWSAYVKELLEWEQLNGGFARSRTAPDMKKDLD